MLDSQTVVNRRREIKLSQAELASLSGVSNFRLGHFERHTLQLDTEELKLIAKAFAMEARRLSKLAAASLKLA